MPAEVEAKFQAEGPAPLAALASQTSLADAELGTARTVREVDRYLDTADGRLASLGWACRLRERDGVVRVSLKGPAAAGDEGWLHRRPELEGPATRSTDPDTWPDSAARSRLSEMTARTPLAERFRLDQRRTEREVRVAGRLLGTLSLDVASVRQGERHAGDLFIVELELAGTDADPALDLERLAAALAARPGLVADPRTKLEHALERLGAAAT